MMQLVRLLRTRAADSKPMVRRAGIQALVGALECVLSSESTDSDATSSCSSSSSSSSSSRPSRSLLASVLELVVEILDAACADVSMAIRKETLSLLSRLLTVCPQHEPLRRVGFSSSDFD
jgi:hypothetical protein